MTPATAARVRNEAQIPAISFAGITIALTLVWLMTCTGQQRLVAVPIAIMFNTLVSLVALLWWRDGVLPVFELGVVCVVVTGVYCIVPPLGYLLADMQWTVFSDNRIYARQPGPEEVGRFIWRHVSYLAALAFSYAWVRGRAFVASAPLRPVAAGTLPATLILIVTLVVYFALLFQYTGVSYRLTHAQQAAGAALPSDLPLFIGQVSHNLSRRTPCPEH